MKNNHLRELDSIIFNNNIVVPPDFTIFVEEDIIPTLNLTGYKQKVKYQTTIKCLLHLVRAGLIKRTVADSRDHKNIGQIRVKIWDCIVLAGLAIKCTGSEQSGYTTRYYATSKLLSAYNSWPKELLKEEPLEAGLIRLKDGYVPNKTRQPLIPSEERRITNIKEWYETAWGKSNPNVDYENNSYWVAVENLIERINSNNLQHTWQTFREVEGVNGKPRLISFQPNVCYRQIHSKEPFRAARLYTWGVLGCQSVERKLRPFMLIDGEKVAELDYQGHHIRMLYHGKRLECKGDPYKPEQICPKFFSFSNISQEHRKEVRKLIKSITLRIINCNDYKQAIGATSQLLKESPATVKKVIYDVENSGAKDLLKRIEKAHTPISSEFYIGKGLELMTVDGYIMRDILSEFVTARKPAIGIHDSIVVKVSDVKFAKKTMLQVYSRFYPSRNAVVDREF